jgi:hypothetical protein
MRKLILLLAAVTVSLVGPALAAEETWTGQISDGICASSHKTMAEQVGYSDKECTIECVKARAKYVLVTNGAVLQISNQDFAGLEKYAGDTVKVTGEKKGDAVVVSKVEAAPAK